MIVSNSFSKLIMSLASKAMHIKLEENDESLMKPERLSLDRKQCSGTGSLN